MFELVLAAGRVIDPETGFDAARDVGIAGGRIGAVSQPPLTEARVIGVLLGYAPDTATAEYRHIARLAARHGIPVFTHALDRPQRPANLPGRRGRGSSLPDGTPARTCTCAT